MVTAINRLVLSLLFFTVLTGLAVPLSFTKATTTVQALVFDQFCIQPIAEVILAPNGHVCVRNSTNQTMFLDYPLSIQGRQMPVDWRPNLKVQLEPGNAVNVIIWTTVNTLPGLAYETDLTVTLFSS